MQSEEHPSPFFQETVAPETVANWFTQEIPLHVITVGRLRAAFYERHGRDLEATEAPDFILLLLLERLDEINEAVCLQPFEELFIDDGED